MKPACTHHYKLLLIADEDLANGQLWLMSKLNYVPLKGNFVILLINL
jgi:hypothetical protein